MAKAKNASDAAATAAWLWKATAKGNPDAPVQLADMYIKGEGVPRSCEQAMVLLKTAAAKENATARNRLGLAVCDRQLRAAQSGGSLSLDERGADGQSRQPVGATESRADLAVR